MAKMMSLLRKIKGYGSAPDLSQKYVLKTWVEFSKYYNNNMYCWEIYEVLEDKSLKSVCSDYSPFKVNASKQAQRAYEALIEHSTYPRWWP